MLTLLGLYFSFWIKVINTRFINCNLSRSGEMFYWFSWNMAKISWEQLTLTPFWKREQTRNPLILTLSACPQMVMWLSPMSIFTYLMMSLSMADWGWLEIRAVPTKVQLNFKSILKNVFNNSLWVYKLLVSHSKLFVGCCLLKTWIGLQLKFIVSTVTPYCTFIPEAQTFIRTVYKLKYIPWIFLHVQFHIPNCTGSGSGQILMVLIAFLFWFLYTVL